MQLRHLLTPLAALLLFTVPAPRAQAPMEDVLWVASRGSKKLYKVSRFGTVEKIVDMAPNGFNLRCVFRAPDGKLWLINYITSTFTILDRTGKVLNNVVVAGSPYAIAFDKTGDAWIAGGSTGSVFRYDATGKFIKTYTVAGSPLGIAVDYSMPTQAGNVWVAHRVGPPGQVSKIDIATGKVTIYTLPNTTTMLPTKVLCDYQGVAKPSNIWVGGDRSTYVVKLDQAGKMVGRYQALASTSYIGGMALDKDNNVWVSGSGSAVVRLNNATGAVMTTFPGAPANNQCGGLVMDSIGRPWVVDRNWSADSILQRYDATTGKLEVTAKVGLNTYGLVDAAGFAYAYVVNPFGDEDKDKEANFIEITKGTSPYDPLSHSVLSFDTRGESRLGKTPFLDAVSANPGTMIVLFGRRLGTPLAIPGVKGALGLDLTGIFGFVNMTAPGKLNLPIPNDPVLVDQTLRLQSAFSTGSTVTFSNLSGIKVSP